MKPALFPELTRVREHADIVGRLPALSWLQRDQVCAWVRAMDAWKAGPGTDAPPVPPRCIFDGPDAAAPPRRGRWRALALAAVSVLVAVGCGQMPGDDMARDFCEIARCPGTCDEVRRQCVPEEDGMTQVDALHAALDAMATVDGTGGLVEPVSAEALGVLRHMTLADMARIGAAEGLDDNAIAALHLVLGAGQAAMWSVDRADGRRARVSVWFVAKGAGR